MRKVQLLGMNPAGVGVTEGGRRPTGVTPTPAGPPAGADGQHEHPNPEVPEKPVRRRFLAAYKLAVLREADACTQYGQLGELLRREGLYSSHLTTWRQQREQGALEALTPKKRGRKTTQPNPLIQRLQRENIRLAARLRQAEIILEIQKKASEILGIPLKTLDNGEHA